MAAFFYSEREMMGHCFDTIDPNKSQTLIEPESGNWGAYIDATEIEVGIAEDVLHQQATDPQVA